MRSDASFPDAAWSADTTLASDPNCAPHCEEPYYAAKRTDHHLVGFQQPESPPNPLPFSIAARGHDELGVIAAMRARVDNATPTESVEAEKQVERLAELRLKEALK